MNKGTIKFENGSDVIEKELPEPGAKILCLICPLEKQWSLFKNGVSVCIDCHTKTKHLFESLCVCGHAHSDHFGAGERDVCGGGEWDGNVFSEAGCQCDGFDDVAAKRTLDVIEKEYLCSLIPHFPDAQKEIRGITGNIVNFYFSLAYGVTPSLFVTVAASGDRYLERIRLVEMPPTIKSDNSKVIAALQAQIAELKAREKWNVIEKVGLPEMAGRYEVTILKKGRRYVSIAQLKETRTWFPENTKFYGFSRNCLVIAWRELPTAYQPTEQAAD